MNKRMLFIYDIPRSFIHRDVEIFERHFHVYEIRWSWTRNLKGLLFLIRIAREIRNADVVVVWFTLLDSVFVALLARLFRTRTIFFIGGHEVEDIREYGYGAMLHPLYRLLLPISFRLADRIIVPSRCSLEHLRRYSSCKNAAIIFHGFDPEKIIISKKLQQAVTVAPIVTDRLYLKGVFPFVEVANLLPMYRFLIIGEIQDEARRLVEEKSQYGNLVLTGSLPFSKVGEILADSRVYCQLSYHESFGCALAEAMLAGCFPVATNCGAMPEVIENVVPLVPFNNARVAALLVAAAMENPSYDPLRYRAHISTNFHISQREKKLIALTTNLLDRRKGGK